MKTQKRKDNAKSAKAETVDGKPYAEIVDIASDYIRKVGGFEKFAEWGLV